MSVAAVLEKPVAVPEKPAALPEPDADEFEPMTHAEFADFCVRFPELRTELTADGELELMPPAFAKTGNINFKLVAKFSVWCEADGMGEGFDSSAGFTLPNGAVRSPDVSWVKRERWASLTDEQRDGFAHICPDFVVEIRSSTDRLSKLRAKMTEYLANGARLGWLLDPKNKRVEIFRPGKDAEKLDAPETLSGEDVLPGFTLALSEIWTP